MLCVSGRVREVRVEHVPTADGGFDRRTLVLDQAGDQFPTYVALAGKSVENWSPSVGDEVMVEVWVVAEPYFDDGKIKARAGLKAFRVVSDPARV